MLKSNFKEIIEEHNKRLAPLFSYYKDVRSFNNVKVLKAMQKAELKESNLASYSGYAYNEPATEKIEEIYSYVFSTDSALVRTSIASGTHAINLMLTGILRPGDKFLIATGTPYDSIHESIGIGGKNGSSLLDYGIECDIVELSDEGKIDELTLFNKIDENDYKLIYFQRSKGYNFYNNVNFSEFKNILSKTKENNPDTIIAVDNCYGEFTQKMEPTEFGADIMAGSLIKNPGGTIALSGGYIVGKNYLVDLCAYRLTAPGLGKEVGGSYNQAKNILQGLYYAPQVVYTALKTAMIFDSVYSELGYDSRPNSTKDRIDIVQSIKLGDDKKLINFVQSIQKSSAIDSTIMPYPWAMPGYDNDIIMASGAFVQGSSIELSADAPLREPYAVFLQGGAMYEQSLLALERCLNI